MYSGNIKIIISLPKKPLTPYHIGDVVNSPLIPDRCASIFANDEKMAKSTTFSAPFLPSSLSPDTKILCLRVSFRVKQLTFKINMTSIPEHVNMDHPCLKGLTSMSHTHHLHALYLFAS